MKHIIALYLCISSVIAIAGSDCEECVTANNPQGFQVSSDINILKKASLELILSPDELEDFCFDVESGLNDSVKSFNELVTGVSKKNPTPSEVKIYWDFYKEHMICPESDSSDEEHFLKRASEKLNLDFIKLLSSDYNLDLNFAIVDPDTGSNFTVLNFLNEKLTNVQNELDSINRANPGEDTIIKRGLRQDIKDLKSLTKTLKANGARLISEL